MKVKLYLDEFNRIIEIYAFETKKNMKYIEVKFKNNKEKKIVLNQLFCRDKEMSLVNGKIEYYCR